MRAASCPSAASAAPRSLLLLGLAAASAHALIWQPPFGTASGNMQSAATGPTSGPMQKLFTISISSQQQPCVRDPERTAG